MSWALALLFRLFTGTKQIAAWVIARPERILALLLIGTMAFLALRLAAIDADRDAWRTKTAAAEATTATAAARAWEYHDAFAQLRIDVEAARLRAGELDAANARRVAAEFSTSIERITDENADLRARNRALLDQRLRDASARAAATAAETGSGGGETDLSGIPDLSDGTVPHAGLAIVPRADLDACADNHAQLAGLIAAWTAAAAIDVNGVSPNGESPN